MFAPIFLLAVASLLVGCHETPTTRSAAGPPQADDGSILPFASAPMGGEVGPTMQQSVSNLGD